MGGCVLPACSWMWSWNILLLITMTAVEPNNSAWQPVWEVVPSVQKGVWSIYIKTAEVPGYLWDSMKEPKWFLDIKNTAFHSFVLDKGKEAKFSAATSCQVLCRSVIGGVHPLPHGQSFIQKLSPVTSTTSTQQQSWDSWWQETAWSPQGVVCLTTSFRGVPKPFVPY